jgi:hypothetical protein
MSVTHKQTAQFIFVKLLPVAVPAIIFYLFNALTPFWWDDFIMACFFNSWYEPHTRLLENFNDIIASTVNMYKTWHGRSVADFLNFFFMFLRDKTIFNIGNTLVYGLCVFLMCYHAAGSVKKIHPLHFLCVNILLWLFIPHWGQNLLWLTGSCNYLWTSTIILLFLVPFRKRRDNPGWSPRFYVSLLWLPVGVLSGWSMENSASGILVLLIAHFALKCMRKERAVLFEITGMLGFMAGFFMLLRSRHNLFPGFLQLVINSAKVLAQFLITDGLLLAVIVMIGIEHIVYKKQKIPLTVCGYFTAALASVAAMVIPGYFGGRACFFTQVFLIITLLSLVFEIAQYTPKRYVYSSFILMFFVFLPSFYSGTKSIVKSWLLSSAREQYILVEKEKGNMNIKVKSPIPVEDAHAGLYSGIDILSDPDDIEYTAHNSGKVTWYGIQSLDGVVTKQKGLSAAVKYYLQHRAPDRLTIRDLRGMIYDNW